MGGEGESLSIQYRPQIDLVLPTHTTQPTTYPSIHPLLVHYLIAQNRMVIPIRGPNGRGITLHNGLLRMSPCTVKWGERTNGIDYHVFGSRMRYVMLLHPSHTSNGPWS
jgi:hypothetical protein